MQTRDMDMMEDMVVDAVIMHVEKVGLATRVVSKGVAVADSVIKGISRIKVVLQPSQELQSAKQLKTFVQELVKSNFGQNLVIYTHYIKFIIAHVLVQKSGMRIGPKVYFILRYARGKPIMSTIIPMSYCPSQNTVCVKPTLASYEKGQTEVRPQIRSNRTRIEGNFFMNKKIRIGYLPPLSV
ncbi:hypothetical protein NQ318_014793 [Aromia moschata]|uniref:Ribosomal protein S3 n=1 Tax=Aromia moschata TaxID=1265417 RepID=A0AAV8ZBM8_9CUCU|nr:hypothetical protein NQ318_014793 [Aromia moschata]